jgi:hypothetical protein
MFLSSVSNKVLRQTVGIPKGTNCTPLIADFFNTSMNLNVWLRFKKIIQSTHWLCLF